MRAYWAVPVLASILILSIIPFDSVFAVTEVAKLTASDAAGSDVFGVSVSISEDSAIVGAQGDDDSSGSAYIFEEDDGVWTEVAKLIASDGAAGDGFGSVSISGDQAVIGAPGNDDNGPDSGSAYIFEEDDGVWTEVVKLIASDGAAGDKFGFRVSISGDQAIVGAPLDDDKGTDSGSAYIFEEDDGVWTEVAKLTASDGAADDLFGLHVSISGDQAVVGARNDDDNGSNSGSAYIFEEDDGVWTEVAKLIASDGEAGDLFGHSVSISDDQVVVGAFRDGPKGPDSGSAYIFEEDDGVWTEVAKLIASDGADADQFGHSVSISDDQVVVGAFRDDDNGLGSGSAYIFEEDDGVWTEVAKLIASDGAANDLFGLSASISEDVAIVGAFFDDDACIPVTVLCQSGSAYIFEVDEDD